MLVAAANSWDDDVFRVEEVKQELVFWLENFDKYNKRLCFKEGKPVVFNLIEGDASATGCGFILRNKSNIAARMFSVEEKVLSSTWRELCNIYFTLVSFLTVQRLSFWWTVGVQSG
jgi:hypothetical protein